MSIYSDITTSYAYLLFLRGVSVGVITGKTDRLHIVSYHTLAQLAVNVRAAAVTRSCSSFHLTAAAETMKM